MGLQIFPLVADLSSIMKTEPPVCFPMTPPNGSNALFVISNGQGPSFYTGATTLGASIVVKKMRERLVSHFKKKDTRTNNGKVPQINDVGSASPPEHYCQLEYSTPHRYA